MEMKQKSLVRTYLWVYGRMSAGFDQQVLTYRSRVEGVSFVNRLFTNDDLSQKHRFMTEIFGVRRSESQAILRIVRFPVASIKVSFK